MTNLVSSRKERLSFFTASSHPGKIRANNEDNFYCDGEISTSQKIYFQSGALPLSAIWAVCDGMGGESHGELASFIAVRTLDEHAEKIKSQVSFGRVNEAVQDFISEANSKLCNIMRKNSFRMGTTLALAIISNDFVRCYNIGDSRIYKLQDEIFSQISEDHTVAEQKVKMGLLTAEEARHDKSKHLLTRCLGVFDDEMILTPYVSPPFPADKEYRLLLCSDGLTDMLPDEHIKSIMLKYKETSSAVKALVDSALQNGGRDNITCIIIDSKPTGNHEEND